MPLPTTYYCSACGATNNGRCSECSSARHCGRCCDRNLLRYSQGPEDRFLGEPSKRYPRYLGIEVERAKTNDHKVYGYKHLYRVTDTWGLRIGSDGSLGGFFASGELSTVPARGAAFEEQVHDLAAALHEEEMKANGSCGLHVHVDVRDYEREHLLNLVRLYPRLEIALFRLIAPSRKRSTYCKPWGNDLDHVNELTNDVVTRYNYLSSHIGGLTSAVRAQTRFGDRYKALNFSAIAEHGTVEFRMHHGTVNETKIKMWAAICSAIVEYAFRRTEDEIRALRGIGSQILDKVIDDKE